MAAWGPAFKKVELGSSCSFAEWNKKDITIEQKNLAPLVSAALGNQSPSNSRSILRADLLQATEEARLKMIRSNLRQLMYLRHRTLSNHENRQYNMDDMRHAMRTQIKLVDTIIDNYRLKKLSLTFIIASILLVCVYESRTTKDSSLRTVFEAYFVATFLCTLLLHYHQTVVLVFIYLNSNHFNLKTVDDATAALRVISAYGFCIAVLIPREHSFFIYSITCLYPLIMFYQMVLRKISSRYVLLSLVGLALSLIVYFLEFYLQKDVTQVKLVLKNILYSVFVLNYFLSSPFDEHITSQLLLGLSLTIIHQYQVWFYLAFNSFVISKKDQEHCASIAGRTVMIVLASFFGIIQLAEVNKLKIFDIFSRALIFGFVPVKFIASNLTDKSKRQPIIAGYLLRISCLMVSLSSLFVVAHGSWLEIGLSISRLIISATISPVISSLLFLAK